MFNSPNQGTAHFFEMTIHHVMEIRVRSYYLTFHSSLVTFNLIFVSHCNLNFLMLSFTNQHNDYFVTTAQTTPRMILSLAGRNKKSRPDVLRREISCITKKCLKFAVLTYLMSVNNTPL
jgi:hypothetical protein